MLTLLQGPDNRAGLTIVPVVPWEGAPDQQLPNLLLHCFDIWMYIRNHKFRGLNVTTTKKGRQLFWGRNVYP